MLANLLPVLLLVLAPQDPAPAPPAPPSPPPSDPAAVELFHQVASAQFTGAGDATDLEGFRASLNLLERGETRREIGLQVLYRHEGGRIRMAVADSEREGKVQKGYDGQRYWLVDGDKPVLELTGREFSKDRDSIDDARKLCDEMLLLMDLRRLEQHAEGLQKQAGSDGAQVLSGVWPRNGETWSFALSLAPDLSPTELSLTPPPARAGEEARPRQRFVLLHYATLDERRIPQEIDEYHDDEREYPVRILEVRQLAWKAAPTAAELAAPER